MHKIALSLMAHPDDCEIMCAGTLAQLHDKGWEIHIATMTPGDCGSQELDRETISNIRKEEARKSAKILDGNYHCLESEDIFIMYDKPTLLKCIDILRKIKPTVVFAPSPSDYMIDHETTSRLVQTACFSARVPNIKTDHKPTDHGIPHLYYVDALEGKDILGNTIVPSMIVDISDYMKIKEEMLSCHESQRNWLRSHHGIDEYIISMKNFSSQRGNLIDAEYGEGFRMHLGNAYPKKNILKEELEDKLVEL